MDEEFGNIIAILKEYYIKLNLKEKYQYIDIILTGYDMEEIKEIIKNGIKKYGKDNINHLLHKKYNKDLITLINICLDIKSSKTLNYVIGEIKGKDKIEFWDSIVKLLEIFVF